MKLETTDTGSLAVENKLGVHHDIRNVAVERVYHEEGQPDDETPMLEE